MRADLLHVISVVSNPIRWQTRVRHAKRFAEHMLDSGVHLTIVETAHGDRDFEFADIPHITHIKTRASTMAWSKESAINVGIRALPEDAKYVCWADSDIECSNPDWASDTVHALQLWPVVQPWDEALDLGPDNEVMRVKGSHVQQSFGYVWRVHGNVADGWKKKHWEDDYPPYAHTGYLWSARMDWLNRVGLLLDCSGAGSADHQMALSMVGEVDRAIHGLSTDSYKAHVRAWADRAHRATQGHIGYVRNRLLHRWHGEKAGPRGRKYVERWDILNKHAFCPMTHLHRNRWGILEISDGAPELQRDLERYMASRHEDANIRLEY